MSTPTFPHHPHLVRRRPPRCGRARPRPAVVILHGGAGPTSVSGFADLLADATGTRVIVPTHPGFGGTPRPEALATIGGLAEVYAGLLATLELEDAVVIGNSIGGWITSELALRHPPQPGPHRSCGRGRRPCGGAPGRRRARACATRRVRLVRPPRPSSRTLRRLSADVREIRRRRTARRRPSTAVSTRPTRPCSWDGSPRIEPMPALVLWGDLADAEGVRSPTSWASVCERDDDIRSALASSFYRRETSHPSGLAPW